MSVQNILNITPDVRLPRNLILNAKPENIVTPWNYDPGSGAITDDW